MVFMEFSLRLGETTDVYDEAFRDSTLAANIELFDGFQERRPWLARTNSRINMGFDLTSLGTVPQNSSLQTSLAASWHA
jgi:hypothetical protein